MPRTYHHDPRSKTYLRHSQETMDKALRDITNGMSYRAASKKFQIHYSVLYRHHKNQHLKKQGGQTSLNAEEECLIVQHIISCAEWGYPMDHLDLRIIIKNYLDSRGKIISKFKNNLPGRDFVFLFLKRHRSSLRTRICQNIKRSRAEVTPEAINTYFDHLENELKDVPPCKIINYDETNLSDDPGRKKIIAKRGCRYPERIMNSSKSSTSVMFAASADGNVLPPYIVYKAQNLYESWTVGGVKGARYNKSLSGWFDQITFGDWVKKIAIPALKDLPGKKFLIGDNLSSHFLEETVTLCQQHNISFIFLPPNSTHLSQPLDVAFFRPLKGAWRKILEKWKMREGRKSASIPKDKFPILVKELMMKIEDNKVANVKAGFRKSGIYPLNRNEVLSRLPQMPVGTEATEAAKHVSRAVVEVLKELRYSTPTKQRKRKRIVVTAGKSVIGADFQAEQEEEIDRESDVEPNDVHELEDDCLEIMESEQGHLNENVHTEIIESEVELESDDEEIPLARLKKQKTSSASYKGRHFDNVYPIEYDSIEKEMWLLVAFEVSHNKNKNYTKYYIGRVINKTEGEIEGTFLRSKQSKLYGGYIYTFPETPDICTFEYEQVIGQVFQVNEDVPSSSTRQTLRFPISQSSLL